MAIALRLKNEGKLGFFSRESSPNFLTFIKLVYF